MRIFGEKISTRKAATGRPGLVAALDDLRPGGTPGDHAHLDGLSYAGQRSHAVDMDKPASHGYFGSGCTWRREHVTRCFSIE